MRPVHVSTFIFVVAACAQSALAHDFKVTETRVRFGADGRYQIDMVVDLDALALSQPPSVDNAVLCAQIEAMTSNERDELATQLRQLFTKRTSIKFDGTEAVPQVDFPGPQFQLPPLRVTAPAIPVDALSQPTSASVAETAGATPASSQPTSIPSYFGVVVRLGGQVPEGASEFTFRASRAFQNVHLYLSRDDTDRVVHYLLEVSEESPPFPVRAAVVPPTRLEVAWRYTLLGFEHILPKGLDHILFVVGLFLLSVRMRNLLAQVSAFTIAHTVTLALSTYGVLRLPPSVVEPLIALSIAYVAIENLFTRDLHVWRPLLVFGFGLLHGMGFAGVLTELGLPKREYVTALLSFNVGVELGQLAVIAIAFLLVGWMRRSENYRRFVVLPTSALIAIVGLYWSIERAFFTQPTAPDLTEPLACDSCPEIPRQGTSFDSWPSCLQSPERGRYLADC